MSGVLEPYYLAKIIPGTVRQGYEYIGGESKIKEAATALISYYTQKCIAYPRDIEEKLSRPHYVVLTKKGVEFLDPPRRKRTHSESSNDTSYQALKALNSEQRLAVKRIGGRTMVLAGPGSGKTRMIVARILYLIDQGVEPKKILAVTFTKKAAREMQERLSERVKGVAIKTFHSLGKQILKDRAKDIGRKHTFRIFDEAQSIPIVKDALTYCRTMRGCKDRPEVKSLNPKDVYHMIGFAKYNQGKFAPKITGIVRELLGDVLGQYDDMLAEKNAIDFADLLAKTHHLFTTNRAALAHYQEVWSHVHVDEYQDTNRIQSEIAELLTTKSENLFVVGYRKQSIYAWRGACPQVVENFQKRSHTQVVALSQNYRCPQAILDAAVRLMRGTSMAEEAKQTCASGIAGEISKYSFKTCEDEANFVIDAVQKKLRAGARGGDIAVLVRTNTQIERFRSKCDEFGIEYFIRENADSDEMAFYKQDEVKAAMAFLQTVTNPKDVQSFVQAAAAIKVLPPTCLSKLEAQLGKLGGASTIVAFCRKFLANPKSVRGFSLPPKSRERLTPFVKNVSQCIDQIPLDNAQAALKRVVEGVGYYSHLTKTYPKTHEEKRRVLDELYGKAEGKSVASFLKPEGDRLHIITLHCAKGLEFDTVFMVGMEEGTFPHFNAIQGESIEEEMRLCYVGITRSKKELYFTHAAWRYKSAIEDFEEMRPSQFLKKIFEAEP